MSDEVRLADVVFERWLAGRPLAERSRREFGRNVRAYCVWLADTADRDGWQGDPLTDALTRDHAARDFGATCRSSAKPPRLLSTSPSRRWTRCIAASGSGARTG